MGSRFVLPESSNFCSANTGFILDISIQPYKSLLESQSLTLMAGSGKVLLRLLCGPGKNKPRPWILFACLSAAGIFKSFSDRSREPSPYRKGGRTVIPRNQSPLVTTLVFVGTQQLRRLCQCILVHCTAIRPICVQLLCHEQLVLLSDDRPLPIRSVASPVFKYEIGYLVLLRLQQSIHVAE